MALNWIGLYLISTDFMGEGGLLRIVNDTPSYSSILIKNASNMVIKTKKTTLLS
jgi:hypothetical protein